MKYGQYVTAVFLLFSSFTFGQTISLKVIDSHQEPLRYASVVVYKSISDTPEISTSTGDSGFCVLHVMPSYAYDIHVSKFRYKKTFIKNIDPVKDTSIVLYMPCPYESSIKDKTCPVCHKQDMAIPIRYGKLMPGNNEEEFYPGGCMMTGCDPNWHCKRDSSNF